ncbi:hypothetical protein [Thalassolituus hydrocarboniclasticus]|uniref:Uncharacterized protein n=1 Tax=Thalassolituus hydrocarboniclasticus TaxID=2742796 RepID=A0ABY6AE80_9GAMM|nr:hypothetical protein [Thalassolituus hydrocarboniclasticus]UXD88769.1 hypothetical protein HUF19_15590 [Thalassolituus hydrocarboniclasticus]
MNNTTTATTLRQQFIEEAKQRLLTMFNNSKQRIKASDAERFRLQGFMQAGVFLGLSNNNELQQLMEEMHKQVFSMSIRERRLQQEAGRISNTVDYSFYDAPAFNRQTSGLPDPE